MTGCYPHKNGMMGLAHLGWHLHDPSTNLPSRLKRLGYTAHLFGEQHEAERAEDLGYDSSQETDWPQIARKVTPAFLEFLTTRQETTEDQPFFASVGFFEAHRPFDLEAGYYTPDDPEHVTLPEHLPDTPEVRRNISNLNGMVRALDQAVGEIVAALEAHGLRRNTLLIFTTDHGLALPRAKGTLYDAGLETTLIMSQPGTLPEGRVSTELVCNVDLLPTLLEAIGAPADPELDGISIWPHLMGQPHRKRESFLAEMTWHDQYAPVRGIRTGRYKYIKYFDRKVRVFMPQDVLEGAPGTALKGLYSAPPEGDEECFDLALDPDETHNIAHDPAYAKIVAELRETLKRTLEERGDPLLRERSW